MNKFIVNRKMIIIIIIIRHPHLTPGAELGAFQIYQIWSFRIEERIKNLSLLGQNISLHYVGR